MTITTTYKGKIRSESEARSFWNIHSRRQNKIIKFFAPKIFRVFKKQYESFIREINEKGFQAAKGNLNEIIKIDPIAKVVRELYLRSAFIESNYVLNYMNRKKKSVPRELTTKRIGGGGGADFGLGFGELAPVIDAYFKIRLLNESAIPITDFTRRYITRHLIAEVDGGKNLQEAITDFKELAIDGLKPKAMFRALRIAKGESTRAMSFGGLIGAYMTGTDCQKVWVTSDDERVRGNPNYPAKFPHVNLDLNSSELLDSFHNGEEIKFPGDPDASIENTAGCRCAMYFREKPKPKPRIARQLVNFLNDFLSGIFLGISIGLNIFPITADD